VSTSPRLTRALLLVCCCAPGALADDLVPSAIEAALAAPDDPLAFGLPELLGGSTLHVTALVGTPRSMVDLGDIDGDGLSDYATGLGPDEPGDTLVAREGGEGAVLWALRPAGGAFRSLRGLALGTPGLALGVSSDLGRVELRTPTDGALLWERDLAAAAGAEPANISSVAWAGDLSGDGVDDLLVAGGGGLHAAWALSGADGSTLWMHAAGDVVYDALILPADGGGVGDVLIVGGETTPFARRLTGADGQQLWEHALDGPGTVGLAVDDIDGDGTPDVAVGQWAEPASCVLALDGAAGTRIWAASDMRRNVTSLALMHDMLELGLRDIAVGSFDNAISALLSFNGGTNWRREASVFNGGSMFSVAVTDDLDGNGSPDVLSSCLDHRVYLHGGTIGQFMGAYETGRKMSVVATLGDRDGDGRSETLIGGAGLGGVLNGDLGLASGPLLEVEPPQALHDPIQVIIWSYPSTKVFLWASLGSGQASISGVVGSFGLDPLNLSLVFAGPTPGAGNVSLNLPAFARDAIGLDIFVQAASVYSEDLAILTKVRRFKVVE